MSPRSFCKAHTFTVSITIHKMINGQPCSLHEGIHNDWPNISKPSLDQILAHGFCFGAPQRNISWISESVDDWFVVHRTPHVAAKRATFPHNLHLFLIN